MKIVFLNVDTQKDFMNSNGKLYVKGAEDIKDNLKYLTELARAQNIKVVNTQDWHMKDDAEISDEPDFKTTFPEHCIVGSEGADFIPETYPKHFAGNYYIIHYLDTKLNLEKLNRSRNIIIYKDKFDVFEGNDLTEEILANIKPDLVIVYGVATDVCVLFAIEGLRERRYEVKVVTDAIKALPDAGLMGLYDKWRLNKVELITTKNVEKLIRK